MPHKLLLADDSITIQRVIELTFADEDVEVIVASDGREAIERLRVERPDIVLADIGMPECDGYQVAEFIKSNPDFSDIPVLLLTGAFERIDENRARSVGCDGVLVKPFEPQMVINRVKDLIAGRRAVEGLATTPPAWLASVPPQRPPEPDVPQETTGVHWDPEAMAPSVAEAPVAKGGGGSLEDYFDRLDAAFANIGASAGRRPQPHEEPEESSPGLPELASTTPARPSGDPITGWDPELTGGLAPANQPHLANAFVALLAEEEGHATPDGVASAFPEPPPAAISEAAIDEIVDRVIARMGDESMRRLVLDTAERLVREEIDRIKKSSRPE